MEKMADNAVSILCFLLIELYLRKRLAAQASFSIHLLQVTADVLGIITERNEIMTLDTCTSLLPILTALLGSDMDQ